MRTLDELTAEIDREVERQGHQLGWSYLYSPAKLKLSARLATVGLNPGGGSDRSIDWGACRQPEDADGNSYFTQRWAKNDTAFSTLQLQIKRIADVAGVTSDEVVSLNLVPFRSPNWNALRARNEAVQFGLGLVKWALASEHLKVIVAFGLGPREELLASHLDLTPDDELATGWGRLTARTYRGGQSAMMIGVPHLSRFALFGRPQAAAIEELIRAEMSL